MAISPIGDWIRVVDYTTMLRHALHAEDIGRKIENLYNEQKTRADAAEKKLLKIRKKARKNGWKL